MQLFDRAAYAPLAGPARFVPLYRGFARSICNGPAERVMPVLSDVAEAVSYLRLARSSFFEFLALGRCFPPSFVAASLPAWRVRALPFAVEVFAGFSDSWLGCFDLVSRRVVWSWGPVCRWAATSGPSPFATTFRPDPAHFPPSCTRSAPCLVVVFVACLPAICLLHSVAYRGHTSGAPRRSMKGLASGLPLPCSMVSAFCLERC
jgi:hypothetical protein